MLSGIKTHLLLLGIHARVGGVMVSIAAFQAVDPGSIPGQRTFFQGQRYPNLPIPLLRELSSPPQRARSCMKRWVGSVGRALVS